MVGKIICKIRNIFMVCSRSGELKKCETITSHFRKLCLFSFLRADLFLNVITVKH